MKHHLSVTHRLTRCSSRCLASLASQLRWPVTRFPVTGLPVRLSAIGFTLLACTGLAAAQTNSLLGVPLGGESVGRSESIGRSQSIGRAAPTLRAEAATNAATNAAIASPIAASSLNTPTLGGAPQSKAATAPLPGGEKGHGEKAEQPGDALPVDPAAIRRMKVAGLDIEEAPMRMGNLDVLAPIGPALERLGVTVTRVSPDNVPGGLNGPVDSEYFQVNPPSGKSPIVLVVGKRVAYINKAEQPLRAAPLVIKDKIWLPVFSLAPLIGVAPRLSPEGTLHLNPTIQSVEFFPIKGVLALTVKTSAPLPDGGAINGGPQIGTLENPYKIYIDFPGYALGLDAVNSINERVVANGIGNVLRVRAGMFQKFPDTARVVLDLKAPMRHMQQTMPDRSIFALMVLDPNAPIPPENTSPLPPVNLNTSLNGITIVVDAGHGGHDSGARGKQSSEKNHTLDIAKRLRDELKRRGATVLMTRDSDYFVTLQGRADYANSRRADLFVSVHIDAAPSASGNGTTTYYWTSHSQALAREVQNELVKASGLKSKGIRQARFFVVRNTWMPSVLLECCYISNPREEKMLLNPAFRQRLANGAAQGISNYIARYGKPNR